MSARNEPGFPASPNLPPLEGLDPAFRLLLACARHPLGAEELAHLRARLAEVADWPDFLALVERHRLHPQALASLRAAGAPGVPEAVLGTLAEQVGAMTRDTLAMLRDLVTLVPAFAAAGIPLLVLKGPPLAQLLFQDPAFRFSRDLDFLVPVDHFAAAMALLEREGHVRTWPEGPINARQLRRLRGMLHDMAFRGPHGATVELHLRADHKVGLPHFLYDSLAQPAQVRVAGAAIPVPPRGALLTHLCIHGSQHKWSRLKWLADLDPLLRAPEALDWEAWIAEVRAQRLERIVAEGLRLAAHFLETPLPVPVQRFVAETRLPAGMLRVSVAELLRRDDSFSDWTFGPGRLLAFQWHRWRSRPSWRLARHFFREAVVGPEAILAVDLPGPLVVCYPFVRLALKLKTRAQRRRARAEAGR